MPAPVTLAEKICDAREKLHLLLTGRLSVEVVVDGYVVKYNRANVDELRAYIRDLEAELNGKRLGGAVIPIWGR